MTFEEPKAAQIIANRILERRGADPDDDEAILARQYLRTLEHVADREERIRVLEAQVADAAYSHVPVLREKIRTLEAQIASEHELPRPGEAGSLEDGKKGT